MAISPEQQSEIGERHRVVQAVSNGCTFPTIKNDTARGSQIADRLRGQLASDALRNYAYHAQLSAKVSLVISQWEARVTAALIARDQESAPLSARVAAVYQMLTRWNTLHENAHEFARMGGQIDAEVAKMQHTIIAAEERLTAIYADAKDALEDLSHEFEAVEWSITAADRAQLALPVGEHVFIACKAEWMSAGKKQDEPDGVLFLTNKRLLFEQTAKEIQILGILGGKKKEMGVLWAVSLQDIVTIDDERKGLFGTKSVITLGLSAGAPFPELVLNIKGGFGGERLEGYIKRVQSGALAPQEEAASRGANVSPKQSTVTQQPIKPENQQPTAPAKPKQSDPLDDARALADQLDAWVNALRPEDREKMTPITYSPQFERSFFFALHENMLSDKALEHATIIMCEAKRRHPIAAALRTGRLSETLRQHAELLLKELLAPSPWHPYQRGEMFITDKFANVYDDIEPTGKVIGGLPSGTLVTYGGAEFGKQFLIDAKTGKYYYVMFIK